MDPHLLQQLQQQLLLHQAQQQQHHLIHPYNPNTFPPYYPPQYQYPPNAYTQSNYTNLYPQPAVLQPPQLTVPLPPYSGTVRPQWTSPMVDQSPYRGISEVGGELFRGHQGNFGYRGVQPSFIGESHGTGRGGLFSEQGVPSTSSHPPHQTYQPPVTITPQKLESASALKTEVSNYQKPQVAQKTMVAWCEVCKASCHNMDALKQHESGRRHQRNLKKMELLKDGIIPGAKQRCTSNPKLEQGGEEKNTTQNVPSEPVGYKTSNETGKKQPEIPLGDGSDNVKRGKKRKKTRTAGVEPPKRKVVIPIICGLCNVKCETQAAFEGHLSGKKHIARYKRLNGHEPLHRPVGLQVLYPPNPMTETVFQPQEGRYIPPHVYQDIQTSEGSEFTLVCESSSTVTTAPETNITTELEISHEAITEAQDLNGISETGQGSNNSSLDSILEPDKVILAAQCFRGTPKPQPEPSLRSKRENAELVQTFSELVTRVEWMKNVMMQLSHLLASWRERVGLKEDVDELRSTTEQPRRDGFGKDQITESFMITHELPPARQRDLNVIEEVANALNQQPNRLGELVLADKMQDVVRMIHDEWKKFHDAIKKRETWSKWMETTVKQLDEQVARIEDGYISESEVKHPVM